MRKREEFGAELASLPASAAEARAEGTSHYFTGAPCKRGHVAKRTTRDGHCVTCNRDSQRLLAKRPDQRARRREYERQKYHSDPTVKDYFREQNAARRALCSMPTWSDRDGIRRVYEEAVRLTEETGIPHHVDHIIPLVHPDVCGLHIPANLQVLSADENWRKSNSFDGTMDNEGWRR